MIESLKHWIIDLITIAIFVVMLDIIVPSGKIKKYVNLVLGFILLIAIINPIIKIFSEDVDLGRYAAAGANFIEKSEIESSSRILQEEQMKQITEVYRKKIISRIEETVKGFDGVREVKADVIINEDYNSDEFGAVMRVYLKIVPGQEEKEAGEKIKIEAIEIGAKEKQPETMDIDEELVKEIEDKVSRMLNVNMEDIVIMS